MSATKSDAIDIFTCKENAGYLMSMVPNKKLSVEDLQSMVNAFANNYKAYVSSTQEMWAIVRHMNRLFLQDTDFYPCTETTYGAVGETIFFAEEINNGLNEEYYNKCGEGSTNFGGIPWADDAEGGYLNGGCPPNDELKPCDSDNRFTWYGNKMARKNKGSWGKPALPCTKMYQ